MTECAPLCVKTSKGESLVVGDPSRARYKVTSEKIGSGSFGVVFKGVNLLTKDQVAIKFELSNARHPQLLYEHKVYHVLRGGPGIPKTRWYGRVNDDMYNVLVMDLLGPNLSDLFDSCHGTFSLKTVLMLATQMLDRIEYVHSKNILHRDIKPNNFVMGNPKGVNGDTVFLIDFGLAKKYRERSTQEHMPFRADKIPAGGVLNGTLRYASVNAHCGIEQSRRDDLESLGYVLVFLTRGSLPWQGITGACRAQRREKVTEIKMSTPVDALCKDLPKAFSDYLKYVKMLRFSEDPDYQYLQGLFQKLFINMNYKYDYRFDWKML